MRFRLSILIVGFTLLASDSLGNLGKSTAYFHDRYGADIMRQNLDTLTYYHPLLQLKSGTIKNRFSRRTYKQDNMTITVIYSLPALKAVLVEYQLPHNWTNEQIVAALSVFSDDWKNEISPQFLDVFSNAYLKNYTYTTESGLVAQLTMGRKLTVYSQELLDNLMRSIQSKEAAKRVVPEF